MSAFSGNNAYSGVELTHTSMTIILVILGLAAWKIVDLSIVLIHLIERHWK